MQRFEFLQSARDLIALGLEFPKPLGAHVTEFSVGISANGSNPLRARQAVREFPRLHWSSTSRRGRALYEKTRHQRLPAAGGPAALPEALRLAGLRAARGARLACPFGHEWLDRCQRSCIMAKKAGWKRIHVKRIPAEGATYMGKYLTKEGRAPCLKGWRLWAAFGPWDSTKVKDVEFRSEYGTILRGIIATKRKRQGHFFRLALTDKIYLKQLGHS